MFVVLTVLWYGAFFFFFIVLLTNLQYLLTLFFFPVLLCNAFGRYFCPLHTTQELDRDGRGIIIRCNYNMHATIIIFSTPAHLRDTYCRPDKFLLNKRRSRHTMLCMCIALHRSAYWSVLYVHNMRVYITGTRTIIYIRKRFFTFFFPPRKIFHTPFTSTTYLYVLS